MRSRAPRKPVPAAPAVGSAAAAAGGGRDGGGGSGGGLSFEELVRALREVEGLRDVGASNPNFHFRSRPFLHFHEGAQGTYADVRFGTGDFEPVRASTPLERAALLARVERHVERLERARKSSDGSGGDRGRRRR